MKKLYDDKENNHAEEGDQKDVLDFKILVEEFQDLSQDLLDLTPLLTHLDEPHQLSEKGEGINPVTQQAKFQSELLHNHFKRITLNKRP